MRTSVCHVATPMHRELIEILFCIALAKTNAQSRKCIYPDPSALRIRITASHWQNFHRKGKR